VEHRGGVDEGPLGRPPDSGTFYSARVLADQVVRDSGVEDRPQYAVALGCLVVASPSDEFGVPLADVLRGDLAERSAFEAR
jgi:hypothetical protein